MKSEHIEILQSLELTATESKAYLTLLETGKCLAGTIADRSHIHRRNVYDALESLLQKGLVTYIISNNRKYWSCISPERINSILEEKKSAILNILPDLLNKFNANKSKQIVEVFEGLGGMKTFYDGILNSKKDLIILFATGKAYVMMNYYMKKWDDIMKKEKIRQKILLNYDAIPESYKNTKGAEFRILPKEFSSPTQIFIYGDKSAVAIWAEEPVATLISNREITGGFRKYFKFLWKLGKKLNYD